MFVGSIVNPYYLLFLHQVLQGYFETEHQFKQKAIIADSGTIEGACGRRVSPAAEILVKTRQRQ